MAEAASSVIVEEDAGKREIQGGPLRGTILHKLMEEVLSGETTDDIQSLQARSAELISQMGQIPAEDQASGLDPAELAQTVANTLALPEISALRDRLHVEFPVFGHQVDVTKQQTEIAISGIADAVALDKDGGIDVVLDWKSDINPDSATREKYRHQIRDYLEASNAVRGFLVYMTAGEVEEIEASRDA